MCFAEVQIFWGGGSKAGVACIVVTLLLMKGSSKTWTAFWKYLYIFRIICIHLELFMYSIL